MKAFLSLVCDEIPVTIINLREIMKDEYEYSENELREDFTVSEKVVIIDAILVKEKEKAKERQVIRTDLEHSEKFTEPIKDKGEAKEIASKKVGWSRPTYFTPGEVVFPTGN